MNWFRKKTLGLLGGGVIHAHTTLVARKKELGSDGKYHYTDERRVVKDKVVTDDFVEDIVDALVAETWTPTFKYHAWGIGTGNEAASDAALGTEGAETRATGTHVESSSKVYQSVGTLTCNATGKAITEYGLFNQEAVGGILMDRTKFAAINVVETNQIEFTFTIAFTSGG